MSDRCACGCRIDQHEKDHTECMGNRDCPRPPLTPEAARAAAEWIEGRFSDSYHAAHRLRAEADRLEAASRTLGQVLAEGFGVNWSRRSDVEKDVYESSAAAVIAHVVGPDRVVVDRFAAQNAVGAMEGKPLLRATVAAFREALS